MPKTVNDPNPHVASHRARLASQGSSSRASLAASGAPGGGPAVSHREGLAGSGAGLADGALGGLAHLAAAVGPSALFETLVQLLPDAAVFAVDAQRNVVCWSDGAERLLGYRRADVLGRYCLSANRCHQCMLGCGISEYGAVADVPLVLLDVDGAQVRVRKTAQAFFDAEGEFVGGVEVLRPEASTAPEVTAERFHGLTTRDPDVARAFRRALQLARKALPTLLHGERGVGLSTLCAAVHQELGGAASGLTVVDCAGRIKGRGSSAAEFAASLVAEGSDAAARSTWVLDAAEQLDTDTVAAVLAVIPAGARVFFLTRSAAPRPSAPDWLALGVAAVYVPPLRARRVDVEPLVWQVLAQRNAEGGRQIRDVAPGVMRRLLDHQWPGNVSELVETLSYAFAVGQGDTLALDDLPPELQRSADRAALLSRPPSPRRLSDVELRDKVCEALALSDGHIGRAAELLAVSRPTLWRWRKQLKLS